PFFSWMWSASMSARSAIAPSPGALPLRVPTTPVPARPRWTSMPNSANRFATTSAVRCSSKAGSGWAWVSRRPAVRAALKAAMRLMIGMGPSVGALGDLDAIAGRITQIETAPARARLRIVNDGEAAGAAARLGGGEIGNAVAEMPARGGILRAIDVLDRDM